MPRRPWALVHTLQSVPLTKSVHPSRGHVLPCGSPTATSTAMLASLSPAVSPTPALLHACLVPRLTKGSLSRFVASHSTFPVTLGHEHRDQLGHSLRPLRSFLPLASPFAQALGFPRPHGRYSPGLSAPLRLSPLTPRVLYPPDDRSRRTRASPRKVQLATPRTLSLRTRPSGLGEASACKRVHWL